MNKTGKESIVFIVLVVAVSALVLDTTGLVDLKSVVPGGEEQQENVIVDLCTLEDISLQVGSNRLGKAGTEPGEGFRMFVNGQDKGIKAEDSSTTVATDDDYVIYAGENSTTYYTVKLTGNVDCKDPYSVFAELPLIDTSVTYVITNDDGTLNSASALSIDQDEIVTIDISSKVDADQYYGNPQADNNLLTCVYNKTMFKVDLANAAKVNTPNIHAAGISTTNTTATFVVDKLANGVKRENELTIEAIGDSDPGAAEDIVCYEYDKDYDLNADTLAEILDVQDEDYNDLGATATVSFTIDVS